MKSVLGNETISELQDLLENIAHEFWFDNVARIEATTHGCYAAAKLLPLLDRITARFLHDF